MENNNLIQQAMKKYFSNLNSMQQQGVFTVNGAVLILAGAGSGKTTVLVNRIANMIYFGDSFYQSGNINLLPEDAQFLIDYINGDEQDSSRLADIIAFRPVNPWNILAITFTNKAAKELKERIENMLGERGKGVQAATFHSACCRILRREAERIGYSSSFTIYDTDDSKRVVKACLKELNLDEKQFNIRAVMSRISHFKDNLIGCEDVNPADDYYEVIVAKIYKLYQQKLFKAGAMDFDDIIFNTVKLFENNPDVLDHYSNLYRYIMVDEYQDTNKAQFELVSMLSEKYKNICVVGDDDQSIYKFRGATIHNILSFESQFADSTVIKLEQNYRSTQNVLNCANSVISNNIMRNEKALWTEKDGGEKVIVYKALNERTEAEYIRSVIEQEVERGAKYSDFAVLYRMNAQSNTIERALRGMPYKVIGGVKFYDRKEIKDMLAYLQFIDNPWDTQRLSRIINEPKRGIGQASVDRLLEISESLNLSPLEIMQSADEYAPLKRASKSMKDFAQIIKYLQERKDSVGFDVLLDSLLEVSGYKQMLKEQGDEGENRLENIEELKSAMLQYEIENAEQENYGLSGFLEEIALYTDVDSLNESEDYIVLMTVHGAKGLEFPTVFIAGMEENIFPSSRSTAFPEDLEEERRLAYVAITRAKQKLYVIHSDSRMLFGNINSNEVSRFVDEMDKNCVENIEEQRRIQPTAKVMTFDSQFAELKQESKQADEQVEYNVGQRVKHKKFGEGTIISAMPSGGDYILEIAFDEVGTKMIMPKFLKNIFTIIG